MVWPGCGAERGISIIYSSLATNSNKLPHMLAWERDLQNHWELEDWNRFPSRSFKGISKISLIEANLKVLTRWYLFPTRLANMFPSSSPQCFRGCHLLDSMLHVWWKCLKIRGFWNKIFYLIHKVTSHLIPKSPSLALLNFPNLENSQIHSAANLIHLPGSQNIYS